MHFYDFANNFLSMKAKILFSGVFFPKKTVFENYEIELECEVRFIGK